jgi:hypothetical protein
LAASLKIFLLTIFCVTNNTAEPKALSSPKKFVVVSAAQAIQTPTVSGTRERYVGVLYRIL